MQNTIFGLFHPFLNKSEFFWKIYYSIKFLPILGRYNCEKFRKKTEEQILRRPGDEEMDGRTDPSGLCWGSKNKSCIGSSTLKLKRKKKYKITKKQQKEILHGEYKLKANKREKVPNLKKLIIREK